jgi:SAM-dependent methyltransferase
VPESHYSGVADGYAAHRPRYPEALYAWLAKVVPGHSLVWEPGAGSGQASVGLAGRFDHVVATELSAAMLERAEGHPRVAYSVGVAEESGLPDRSVDLVAVAQALHWFDFDRFYAEVRRVLVPGGIIAAWSYGILQLQGPAVDAVSIEVHVVRPELFGVVLLLATGSAQHVDALRAIAAQRGVTLTRDVVRQHGADVSVPDEEDVYALLGLACN